MGMAVAEKLACLGCRVLAYDKYKKDWSDYSATAVEMDVIFQEADIFSIHVPLTSETRTLVNADYFDKFQKPAFIVNTARGEILDLNDLITAIDQGKIKGCCAGCSRKRKAG